jgi:Urocanase Rossmann-like domain
LTPDPIPSSALDFAVKVERLYSTMIEDGKPSEPAEPDLHPDAQKEPSLGGKLLYAAELVPHGRALLVAANIAGAASLAATADPAAGKQAMRDGVADFLVNSLDEALRILKNEIRKREAAAVCVAMAPEAVEREMMERGVVPDLLADLLHRAQLPQAPPGQVLVTWTVTSAPAQWLPRLDALAIDCLRKSATGQPSIAARWLRLAPRYLGRLAQNFRLLHCQPEIAQEFVSRTKSAVDRGEIAVEVQITINGNQSILRQSPHPPTDSANSLTC